MFSSSGLSSTESHERNKGACLCKELNISNRIEIAKWHRQLLYFNCMDYKTCFLFHGFFTFLQLLYEFPIAFISTEKQIMFLHAFIWITTLFVHPMKNAHIVNVEVVVAINYNKQKPIWNHYKNSNCYKCCTIDTVLLVWCPLCPSSLPSVLSCSPHVENCFRCQHNNKRHKNVTIKSNLIMNTKWCY